MSEFYGFEIETKSPNDNLIGFELLAGARDDKLIGLEILERDTIRLNVTTSGSQSVQVTITISGSGENDGTYNLTGSDVEFVFIQNTPANPITIDISAPGHASQQLVFQHFGEFHPLEFDVELESVSLDFTCQTVTETTDGADLGGKLISTADTVVKGIFTSNSGVPSLNTHLGILRLDNRTSKNMDTLIELDQGIITESLDGLSLIYSATLSPSQHFGYNKISARITLK